MVAQARRFKFGGYGDGGLGQRIIFEILAGRKTATSCLAYEVEDAGIAEGDRLDLVDKRGLSYGTLVVTKVEIRLYGTYDDALAAASGVTLAQLKEMTRFANSREPFPDEEMRVVYFKVVSDTRKK